MCFVCKQRFFQKNLHRFWIKDSTICLNLNHGKSSYICSCCLEAKNLAKIFSKVHKIRVEITEFKEMILNG